MENKIIIIGLGYVGLPLAIEFGKKFPTIGFDIDKNRIQELNNGFDRTLEVTEEDLNEVFSAETTGLNIHGKGLFCTYQEKEINSGNFYIVTVPTPIDKNKKPVLEPLKTACTLVGKALQRGNYVVFESTVYPGVTEDECVPILEKESGLRFNEDFFVGYSPERINPGDKERTVTKILKVTSGSTPESARIIDQLYKEIIPAGTYLAPSIKVAEAAKVIENSQRDLNIAFVNELSKIFNLLKIDTHDVLEAASTKWNFLQFKPGLVGGHCIGVDPYYLAQKAQEVGYNPEIILSGRRLNDSMGKYIAGEVIKLMIQQSLQIQEAKILILGITFKENCPDIRNTKAIDIYEELTSYNLHVDIFDPWANNEDVFSAFGFNLKNNLTSKYSAIILAVAHKEFIEMDLRVNLLENGIVYDVKGVLDSKSINARL